LFLEHDADTRDGEVEVGVGRAEDEVEHADREEQEGDRDVGGCRDAAAVVPPVAGRLAAVVSPHCQLSPDGRELHPATCNCRIDSLSWHSCLLEGLRFSFVFTCFVYAIDRVARPQGSNDGWLHFSFAEVHSQAESEKEKNGCLGIAGD